MHSPQAANKARLIWNTLMLDFFDAFVGSSQFSQCHVAYKIRLEFSESGNRLCTISTRVLLPLQNPFSTQSCLTITMMLFTEGSGIVPSPFPKAWLVLALT